MKYLNTKTGSVIEVSSEIKGGDWIPVQSPDAPITEEKNDVPTKKRTKKS